MRLPLRVLRRRPYLLLARSAVAAAGLACFAACPYACAAERAYVLADAASGAVYAAKNANALSFPASLTKMMTAHLVVEAVAAGEISLDQPVTVSEHAASQPPVKLGLQPGTQITLERLLLALVVRSANDAAVAAAEAVAGSEGAFVDRMNERARDMGMLRTRFSNASGLPHPAQVSSAHDMAVLGRAIYAGKPENYGRFSTRSFDWNGRTYRSHLGFFGYRGADGLKTGFTCASGYNLVGSARRGERRLIGVVLGAESPAARTALLSRLMNEVFSNPTVSEERNLAALALDPQQGHDLELNPRALVDSCLTHDASVRPPSGWSIEFGLERSRGEAARAAGRFKRKYASTLRGGRTLLIPRRARQVIYRVGLTRLGRAAAVATCQRARAQGERCLVLSPAAGAAAARQARLARGRN